MKSPPAQTYVARPVQADGLARYLSILGWLPGYKREWLRGDLVAGLLGAVVLSVLLLVYHASRPDLSVLGRLPGGDDLGDVSRTPESRSVPGLLIVRPNEGLFFANAAPLRERVLALAVASDPPPRAVLLDLEMSNELDVPGADALADLHEELAQRGVTTRIGADRIYRRSLAAALDCAATVGDGPAPEGE